jgi:hypothetical protein
MVTATSTGRKPKFYVDGLFLYQMHVTLKRSNYLQLCGTRGTIREHLRGGLKEMVGAIGFEPMTSTV